MTDKPDRDQIPHLLNLLADESPEIQQNVLARLEEFGESLPAALEELDEPIEEIARERLQPLLARLGAAAVNIGRDRRFVPGQLVKHCRYGYRGVIVGFDLSCQADEKWYRSNRTQPARNQPWYHVLVDGSTQVTYAAESSLQPDTSLEPIRHPMLNMFFHDFEGGRYRRNDHPWPFS